MLLYVTVFDIKVYIAVTKLNVSQIKIANLS